MNTASLSWTKLMAPSWQGPGLLRALTGLLVIVLFEESEASNVGSLISAGDTLFGQQEFTAAVQAYTQAIDLDSKTPLLYTKRAAVYISMRQQSNALRDLNQALAIDDSNIPACLARGKLQRQVCNFEAAARDFKKVLLLKPTHQSAHKELEALTTLQQRLQYAETLKEHGDKANARVNLQGVLNEAQDCTRALLLDAQIWMEDGDYEQVVAVTGRLLKSEPSHLAALVLRGRAYFYLFDHDLAKRHFGEALKYDPDCPEAKAEFTKVKTYDRSKQQADQAAEAGDAAEAESLYSRALHLDQLHRKGNVGLWAGLSRARASLGRHREAAEGWEAVLNLENGNREALLGRIRALMALEEWAQAQSKAQEALQQHREQEFHDLYTEAAKRLKMATRKDFYKILGVAADASDREIKRSYRELAKQYHPDKVQESEKKQSEDKFRAVAEAYEVLSDEEKRAKFDRGEDIDDQQQQQQQQHHWGQQGQQFHFQWGN